MVNLITFHMAQHAAHSGYSQLARYLDARVLDGNSGHWFSDAMPVFIRQRLIRHSGLDWYGQADFAAECLAISRMFRKKREVFHFLYGDNSFYYTGRFAGLRGHKLIATYHLPPEIFSRYVHRTDHIRRLDAVICVASCQKDFFSGFLSKDRIVFIPHGIDTDFFKPAVQPKKEKKACLFVGNMQRDFQAMARVARIILARDKTVKFIIVNRKANLEYFKGIDNITLKTDLKDEELLDYYQQAEVLIQPMKFNTANNSILEAAACGLPVITTDIGGVRDYLDEDCSVLVPPGQPDLMADKLLELLASEQRMKKLSINIREKALTYSWSKIADRLKDFYSKI